MHAATPLPVQNRDHAVFEGFEHGQVELLAIGPEGRIHFDGRQNRGDYDSRKKSSATEGIDLVGRFAYKRTRYDANELLLGENRLHFHVRFLPL